MQSLVDYSDSEESGQSDGSADDPGLSVATDCAPKVKQRLPPPKLPPQATTSNGASGASGDHQGRIRSFPHVEGNFPGYIFLKVDHANGLGSAADGVLRVARGLLGSGRALHAIDPPEMHVSLSRTFAVRRHHIGPLVELLTQRLGDFSAFSMTLSGAKFYCNDEQTRTFVGIKVMDGADRVKELVLAVDRAMRAFKLPSYYSEADFHVSVGWSAGDMPSDLSPDCPCEQLIPLAVNRLHAKIGARSYIFDLKSGRAPP